MKSKALLTKKQVAELLNCSQRHVQNLISRKIVSYIKLGGSLRFDPTTLEREIETLTRKSQTVIAAERRSS